MAGIARRELQPTGVMDIEIPKDKDGSGVEKRIADLGAHGLDVLITGAWRPAPIANCDAAGITPH